MKNYLIRHGAFVLADGSRLEAGQQIELADDVARDHADQLEPIPAVQAAATPGTPPEQAYATHGGDGLG